MIRKALVTGNMVVALVFLFVGVISLWTPLSFTVWDDPGSHLGIRCKSFTVEFGYSNTVISSSIPTTSGPTLLLPRRSQKTVVGGFLYSDLIANGTLEWTSPTGFQVRGGGSSSYRLRFVKLSIWVPVAVFAGFPLFTFIRGPFRRWRRKRKGWCIRCGYNLQGNVSGVCPECGRAA